MPVNTKCVEIVSSEITVFSAEEIIAYKALYIIALLGLLYGLHLAIKAQRKDPMDYIAFGIAGFLLFPLAAFSIYWLFRGIAWAFS